MILVDAVYTNQSGSKRLLEYFINYAVEKGVIGKFFFLLDKRIESETLLLISEDMRSFCKASEFQRRKYYKTLRPDITAIFCFGSVPPPVKISDRRVIILQHNPFFFENPGYSFRFKIFYMIKRLYIRSRCQPGYLWLVQTPRIKTLLIENLGIGPEKIAVKPFFEPEYFHEPAHMPACTPLKFVYVADGVPQKNHIYLFKVWERLYTKFNLIPELHLTLPEKYVTHLREIKRLQDLGLRIFNHGFIAKSEVKDLYQKSHFLVFPSLSESFGLPLAEAASAGLKVIGSDLPYLYQVIEPSAVFHPKDHDSLVNIIVSLHSGLELRPTIVRIEDHISDLFAIFDIHD